MYGLGHDLRCAFRSLARRPGLAAAAIATLALGIGANVAVFSVVDGLILRSLPVRDPASLGLLTWSSREWPKIVQDLEGSTRKDPASGTTFTTSFPYPVVEAIRSRSRAFAGTFAIMANDPAANLQIAGHGASAVTKFVSGSFFDVLGVAPAAGRMLVPADDRPGAPPVAVISHRSWLRLLGGDPSAVGRSFVVNGRNVILVGVLPESFFGLEPGAAPDLWMPLHAFPIVFPDWMGQGADPFSDPGTWWVEVGGSLGAGRPWAQALEESRRIFEAFLPRRAAGGDPGRPVLAVRPIARGEDWTRHRLATPLLILFGLSAVVLAIACTNVAGLLLAKATARTREIAIRRSLGANTARLVRQLLTESLVLALAASAAAWIVAQALTAGVLSVMTASRNPLLIASPMNGRVLLFGIAAAAVTGILAGLVPAWRVSHAELTPSLKEAPEGLGSGRRGGGILVAAQVALGLLLVTAAGLFARTLTNLRRVDLGFRPDHVALFSIRPGLNGYSGERLAGFYDQLRDRLEAIPGVRAATLALHGTIGSGESTTTIAAGSESKERDVHVNLIGAHYFETLRIPILAGRTLDDRDRQVRTPAAVINRELARTAFGGAEALGRTFRLGGPKDPVATVVGVVGDARYNRIRDAAPPTFYLTYRERPTAPDEMMFHVRYAGDPGAAMAGIRATVAALDPNLPVVDLQTQDDAIDGALSMERIFAILTSSFASLALLLAAIGLYAGLAFSVARRTREIGVRIALGATPGRIRGSVLRDALTPTVAGLAAGSLGAVACTRLLRSQLFGLSALDPAVLAGSAGVLLAAAALAAWLPARRASSVDPMTALRVE
ncbi:MAG TPA: ABC transporter permease [Thermoanaerobaculia bacterium]|nr:ABC transporter permease [Thermoanaerobaculia bacterium]